jgi:hypothetical protein
MHPRAKNLAHTQPYAHARVRAQITRIWQMHLNNGIDHAPQRVPQRDLHRAAGVVLGHARGSEPRHREQREGEIGRE